MDVDRRPLTRLDERSGIDHSVATDHDVVRTSDLDRAANECARRNIDGCIAPNMKDMSAGKNVHARAEGDEAPLSRRAVSRPVHEEVNVVEDVAVDLERDIGGRTQTKRRGLAVPLSRTGITPRDAGRTRADEIVPDRFVSETSTAVAASNVTRVARDLVCRSTFTATALTGPQGPPPIRALTL